MNIADIQSLYAALKDQARKVIVGQEDVIEQLVVALLTGG